MITITNELKEKILAAGNGRMCWYCRIRQLVRQQ